VPFLSGNVSSMSFFNNNKNGNNKSPPQPILLDASGNILSTTNTAAAPTRASESGSLLRTFLLGGSSALVASPCATPVLTSILAYVAQAQNTVLGALLLGCYTAGYATPLLYVAATGGQALVKWKSQPPGRYAAIAPWITPLTAAVLLYTGTSGLLVALFGDPSVMALAPVYDS